MRPYKHILERNGGEVDIPEHVRDLEASKLISL